MTATAQPTETEFRGAYGLSEDQELFKRMVHEFAELEIVPVAHDLD